MHKIPPASGPQAYTSKRRIQVLPAPIAYTKSAHAYPCLSAVSLQYICSVSAVSTSCALDRPAVHKG